jgi:hypothetical protein
MRRKLASFFAVALLGTAAFAQSYSACRATPASIVDHRDGITVEIVSFQRSSVNMTAHVFVPDSRVPLPGIAFSHSSIQYSDSLTSLLPFAKAMARAGAATIMLDGTIAWLSPNDESKRPWTEVACAAQWLMANVKLDMDRLAIGGPIDFADHSGISHDPFCPLGLGKNPCGLAWFYINFGWVGQHEAHYTELMKTPRGQLWMTKLPEDFHLRPVQLEWLMDAPLGLTIQP